MTNPCARAWGRVRQCFRSGRKKNYEETDAENMEMRGVNSSETNFVEVDLLRADINATRNFPNNAIRTSKYTWLTSFPLSLANQFRNVSNPYFLIVVCFTLIPGMSPINPFSSVLPLSFVIIAGMAKDIWEDKKRQESDKRANAVEARVLRGNEFVTISAREVQVGDILLHRLGDEVLADAIVLNTSHADGVLYIETANLDGETNAKTRRAKPQTIEYLGTVEDIIDQCLPNANLREHYVKYGTTSQWPATAAHASMPPANGNRDRTDAPRPTATATATTTTTILTKGTKVSTGATTQPVPSFPAVLDRTRTPGRSATFRMSRSLGDIPERMDLMPQPGATHARSHTFGGDDPCELRRGIRHHCRQPTFDERFAVGSNLPVPSDIAHMSREYEQRHHLDRASMCCASEHTGASIRLEGGPTSDVPTTNIPLGELTGEGSGVVLLAATPRADLYSWIGQLRMMDGETVPLDIEQFIPRGCVVRNTEWVLCAVVYTGRDTKMLLNYLPKSRKVSVIGKRINILNAILFILHQIFVLLLCGLGVYWRNAQLIPPEGTRSGHSIWYIQWQLSYLGPAAFFFSRYVTYFVLLSYFIPLSLYVTLEFNKAMQMVLLARDRRMADFDEFSGELRYSRPKTSELNCQLAHVRYIFTDKTGTLTENLMTYVGGCTPLSTHDERKHPGGLGETFLQIVCRDQRGKPSEGSLKPRPSNEVGVGGAKVGGRNVNFDFNEEIMEEDPTFQYLRVLALCHTVVCFDRAPDNASMTPETLTSGKTPAPQEPITGENGTDGAVGSRPQVVASKESHERLLSAAFGASLSMNGSSTSGVGRHLHGRTGSSCWYAARHNEVYAGTRSSAMPFEVSKLCDRSKIYEGQSLDEIALVTAARDNLFTLYRRSVKHMFVKVIDKIMCYEIIAELGFSPQRKLMSILLCRSPEYDHLGTAADPQQQAQQKEGEGEGEGEGEEEDAGRPKMGYHLRATSPPHEAESRPRTQTREPSAGQPLITFNSARPQRTKFDFVNEELGTTVGNSTELFSSIAEHVESDEWPYLLLVKGADNSMLNIVNKQNPRNALLRPVFQRDLEEMARQGLRTLMLGQRYCTEREVRGWLPHFNEALCSMDNRNEKLHEVYALMERDVDLIGTTAVEDRLQEGVPETLNFFLRAEVVVWMLTGDKRETAVAIAGTSGIIDEQFEGCVYHLDVTEVAAQFASPATGNADNANTAFTATEVICVLEGQLDGATAFCDESAVKYEGARTVVLVVDGRTLDFIFASEVLTQRFFELGCRCRSAVCCRMTPLHKANIVRLFHKYTNGVTLAVGDGANDVSMIQESHIGVGIMGLEGSQAELASDYSIPKFRFLKRLLVVHGRFSLYRDGNCIVFSIYKNVALTSGLTAYSFFSGYSGITLIESWLIALFNVFFCAFQPLVIGTLDKDVEDELAESLPAIYPALAREEMFFSWRCIFKCLFDGVAEGLLMFFLVVYTVAQHDELYPWHSSALEDYGMLLFLMILLLMNIRAALFVTCYTAVSGSVIVFGFVSIPFMTLLYSALPSILGSNWSVYVAMELMGTLKLWMFILFAVGLYVVYGLAVNTYMMLFWPWTNGGPAMTAAWRSPYRLEHHGRRQRLKKGQELLWESKSGIKRRSVSHLRSQQRTAGRSGMSAEREE